LLYTNTGFHIITATKLKQETKMRILLLLCPVILYGCIVSPATSSAPVMDLRGVDMNKWNKDKFDCEAELSSHKGFSWGNPYEDCLYRKGYKKP
jgi:hypothetical protein